MFRKLLLAYVAVGVMAGIAASNTYRVHIGQDSAVSGKMLKAGEYKVELQSNLAVIKQGKQTIEVPAHSESVARKFSSTEIAYIGKDIQEIHVGGSRTKIVFESGNATAGIGQ